MTALFDRISQPFGESKINRIRINVNTILEKHLPDFDAPAQKAGEYLKSQDRSFLENNACFVEHAVGCISKGSRRIERFKAKIDLSVVRILTRFNRTNPQEKFPDIVAMELNRVFRDELESFSSFKREVTAKTDSLGAMTAPRKPIKTVLDMFHSLADGHLLFLADKERKKRVFGKIAKEIESENSYKKRMTESISEELQRIMSTKVYTDADTARRTVMNYGIPDIVNFSGGNGNHYDRICRELKESIEAFEPRLANPRVSLVKTGDGAAPVKCYVEGTVGSGESGEIIRFPLHL